MRRRIMQRRFVDFYKLYVGDFDSDVPLYLELAAKAPGPVLEVGCATGRVTAHLASAGHEVIGVDVCREALELAKRHLKPWDDRARVQDFDLRAQILPERFAIAIVPLYFFNCLIDIEEQRLFLRHLRACVRSPGIVALDLFCPLAQARPEAAECWRTIERVCGQHQIRVRDRREMLTPLLERRTQVYQIDGEREAEYVSHRRYVPPSQAMRLLEESGFERARWLHDYDLGTATDQPEHVPLAPFVVLAEA
jgi:SAM-dependent methyltransferase